MLLAAAFFLPWFAHTEGLNTFTAYVTRSVFRTPPAEVSQMNPITIGAFLVAIGTAVISIFVYKKRLWQIKMLFTSILAIIAILFGVIFSFYTSVVVQVPTIYSLRFGAVCTLMAIILQLVAIQGIRKDEKLVRGMDRLR